MTLKENRKKVCPICKKGVKCGKSSMSESIACDGENYYHFKCYYADCLVDDFPEPQKPKKRLQKTSGRNGNLSS